MKPLTYEQLVRELFPRLSGGIRWGLDRVENVLAAAGNPERRFASVHVGGTNGKGSVSATIESVMRRTPVRTALYTSPHLCSFRERIQIAGLPISERDLLSAADRLWPALTEQQATFFEATTAIAFEAFAAAKVELAIIEVGLGGRLDATNVITPAVSVITNVTLDHTDMLGDTVAALAVEKAGIIKPGVPVITADTDTVVRETIERRAAEAGAPFSVLESADVSGISGDANGTTFVVRTRAWGELLLRTPLSGVHHATNAALAVRALELLPESLRPKASDIAAGVAEVHWPGRTQIVERGHTTWLLDVAHNAAGVRALVGSIEDLQLRRPIVLLAGVLSDKDWRSMLPPLLAASDAAVLTVPPSAPPGRRWDPHTASAETGGTAEVVMDFERALRYAADLAGEGTVLVTGSFHTVGDALSLLGVTPFGLRPDAPVTSEVPGARE